MRLIALLLAVMMMTGAAGQVYASPDVASEVDEPSEVRPLMASSPLVAPKPELSSPRIVPTLAAPGRIHAVSIFRPPRLVTSR